MRKSLQFLMAAIMTIVAAITPASAATSGSCGDYLSFSISDEGVLTITGTGAMTDYGTSNAAPWNDETFTSVIISDGVTTIGDYAFRNYSSLESIELPSTITSIGENAFYGCSSLTSIVLPSALTTIGDNAFSQCTALATVDLSACTALTTIGEAAFSRCSALTSIDFSACTELTTIGDEAFMRTGLTLIDLSACTKLTTIEARTFENCTSLTSVDLPSSITTIENNVFYGCSSLTSLTVRATSLPTINDNAFSDFDPSNCTLYVPAESLSDYEATSPWSGFNEILPIGSVVDEELTNKVADLAPYFDNPDCIVVVDGTVAALPSATVEELQEEYEALLENPTEDAYEALLEKVQAALVAPENGIWTITSVSTSGRPGQTITSVNTVFYYPSGTTSINSLTTAEADVTDAPMLWQFTAVEGGGYKLLNVNTNRYLAGSDTAEEINLTDGTENNTYTLTARDGDGLAIGNGSSLYLSVWGGSTDEAIGLSDDVDDANCGWNIKLANAIDVTIASAGMATVCFPVAVELPSGVTAYTKTSATANTVYLAEYEGTVLPANTGVLITGEGGSYSFAISDDNSPAADTGFGGFCPATTVPTSVTIYLLGLVDGEIGFYRLRNYYDDDYVNEDYNRTVNPNKAYYNYDYAPATPATSAATMRISFGDESAATGITTATSEATDAEKVYYDLNGRRVLYPTRGIYVTADGQKVFIK